MSNKSRLTITSKMNDPAYAQMNIINARELAKVEALERGHKQWKKQGVNFCIFLILAFINLYRGSKKEPSLFGVEVCSWQDWTSLGIFVVICVCLSIYALKRMQREQWLKINYGKGLASSDVQLEGKNLAKLMVFSFLGGWVSGALGLGGGAIFNPLLLSMGLPPKVASSTGMYMIIFSTGASTITYIINDMLDVSYGLWVGSFCVMGTLIGMYLLNKMMKKLGRQSPLVMLLTFILGISAVAVPYFGLE